MSGKTDTDTYALRKEEPPEVPAPDVNYRPPQPRTYSPQIGLIGAGGIAASHLDAYRTAGWNVTAIGSRTLASAEARRDEFFPGARATDDADSILSDPDIEVVDITPHPAARIPLVEAALRAGKHVLSQKPFVEDLATGERLLALADANGVKLGVNQNGRWAPHLSWMREAVRAGLVGDVTGVNIEIHWDHNWTRGTSYEDLAELILLDFGIHWCDFLVSLVGSRIRTVQATRAFAVGQDVKRPLMGQVLVTFDGGQASMVFDGSARYGPRDTTTVVGTKGTLQSVGPNLSEQTVTLINEAGRAQPELEGTWFNDGFRGTMGELLCAIEEDREPLIGARENLTSLRLCFGSIESADRGSPVDVAVSTPPS